ncbi:MAG: L-threonylcarbamoyladenylate synthase [Holosporaceae bacterium]
MSNLIQLKDAVDLLKKGRVVVTPSETVYGLCGNAFDDDAVKVIFHTKRRPSSNPLIVHYATQAMLKQDVIVTPSVQRLMNAFCPGPLTFVLNKKQGSRLASKVSAGLETVAVRLPSHPVFQELLRACGFPLAAPSANVAGTLSPTHPSHVWRTLKDVPVVAGEVPVCGLESTVVDLRGETPLLLRPGALAVEALEAVLQQPFVLPQTAPTKVFHSPGLFPRHYAPSKPLRLEATSVASDEGLLAFGPCPLKGAHTTVNLSEKGDLSEAAQRFFELMHHLDQSSCQRIAVMPIPFKGAGVALNDRLKRAATSG